VFAADGSIQAITAASLEITQQKKAEEALIRSEKLAVVGRLASSIAHEINNPLESVTNLIYLAQNSNDGDDVRRYLETAEMELRRASAITSQTLRFHRQSTSRTRQTYEGLMDSVLEIFRARIVNSWCQSRSAAAHTWRWSALMARYGRY
jgi:phosphoglycerate-specific signal transduction histidine kinase